MKRQVTNLAKRTLPFGLRLQLRRASWSARYLRVRRALPAGHPPVWCPVAARAFDCFIPEGSDLLTPSNGAKARHRLLWLYLQRETKLFTQPARLLHVAPEVCLLPKLQQIASLDYVPADKFVDGYGKQASVQYFDLLDAHYADASFDYILCNHVLEHIPDDAQAMRELYRLLAPGGTAIITVPIKESLEQTYENWEVTDPEERAAHFGQWDHVRYYGLDVADRLQAAGFAVELVRYGTEVFDRDDFRRYGLNDSFLVVCRKE